jgi:hypothetical protein
MFGNGKVWPYMALFATVIFGVQALSGWHGISVVALVLVALVGVIDFVWTAERQRR